jgi:hypothetical protein
MDFLAMRGNYYDKRLRFDEVVLKQISKQRRKDSQSETLASSWRGFAALREISFSFRELSVLMEGYRRPPAGHPFDDATRLESSSALLPEDFYRSTEVSRIRSLWPAGTVRDQHPTA